MRTAVVLPAPLGPSSPKIVPSSTAKLTPSRARTSPPKVFFRSWASMALVMRGFLRGGARCGNPVGAETGERPRLHLTCETLSLRGGGPGPDQGAVLAGVTTLLERDDLGPDRTAPSRLQDFERHQRVFGVHGRWLPIAQRFHHSRVEGAPAPGFARHRILLITAHQHSPPIGWFLAEPRVVGSMSGA